MLRKLAEKVGIIEQYHCFLTNTDHVASEDTIRRLLTAFGFDVSTDEKTVAAYNALIVEEWSTIVSPVLAVRTSQLPLKVVMNFPDDLVNDLMNYELVFESGNVYKGDFIPHNLRHLGEAEINGKRFYKKELVLNIDSEWGYHNFKLYCGGQEHSSLVIIAPEQAYKPDNLKHWGIPVQLYAVKSERNWGMGDFTDLRTIIDNAVALGASLVGLNPVTALKPHDPEGASPYSVSSRFYLNILYIDVDAVFEAKRSQEYIAYRTSKEFADLLRRARESKNVDYTLVSKLKLKGLRILYNYAKSEKGKSYEAFRAFLREEGESVEDLGTYQAICEEFGGIPPEYRDKSSKTVAEWKKSHADAVGFYEWTAWIALNQFKEAGLCCFNKHLTIGLYQDLAVGVSHASAEVWSNPRMFLADVGVGSPPDDFCADGQNWGLAPMNPLLMRKDRYNYYIRMIRRQMAESGALRIDHAMGLKRMFFIPNGTKEGAYVNYPFDEMLAIIVLESHRNSCVVIGEDLGNMPEGFSEQMNASGILSMVVGRWIMSYDTLPDVPFADKYMSLLAYSNHDMPTLAAYWQMKDIELFRKAGFIKTDEEEAKQKKAREEEKRRLIVNLSRKGLFFYDGSVMPKNLVYALFDYLSRAPNYLFLPQIEDLLLQEQQINLPGTDRSHPNWRYKLDLPIERWLSDERVLKLAKLLRPQYG